MSAVYRCDRCGKIFDTAYDLSEPIVLYPADINGRIIVGDEHRDIVDLCGTCTQQLERWLVNRSFEPEVQKEGDEK